LPYAIARIFPLLWSFKNKGFNQDGAYKKENNFLERKVLS
jgi:hypothetical protein